MHAPAPSCAAPSCSTSQLHSAHDTACHLCTTTPRGHPSAYLGMLAAASHSTSASHLDGGYSGCQRSHQRPACARSAAITKRTSVMGEMLLAIAKMLRAWHKPKQRHGHSGVSFPQRRQSRRASRGAHSTTRLTPVRVELVDRAVDALPLLARISELILVFWRGEPGDMGPYK